MMPTADAWADAFPDAAIQDPPLWLGAVRLFTPDLNATLPALIKRLRPGSISTGQGSAVLVAGATIVFVEECCTAHPTEAIPPFFDTSAPLAEDLWEAFDPPGPTTLAVGGHGPDGFPALILSTRL